MIKYIGKERDVSMQQFIQQLIDLHIEVYNYGKSKPNDYDYTDFKNNNDNNDIFDTTYCICHCQNCVDWESVRYRPY